MNKNFLENASKIVDAALALKKSMEQHGYAFHNGSFERAPEDTHQYCYCHTVPEQILPNVSHYLGFSRGKLYEFHMCFRMATPKECEQAESGKAITVRDYIEHLKTLDQDRNIWVSYDFPYDMFAPIPDKTATEREYEVFGRIGVKEGDYIINASC